MARSKRSKGLKDKAYLEWIRSLACVACGQYRNTLQADPTEAAHVGQRGLSRKCSDHEAIPLCTWHHTEGPTAQHKLGKKFWQHHSLDRDALILQLNQRYESEKTI